MSRIDQALRIRESGAAPHPTDAPDTQVGSASALHQYAPEERVPNVREPRHAWQEPVANVTEPGSTSPMDQYAREEGAAGIREQRSVRGEPVSDVVEPASDSTGRVQTTKPSRPAAHADVGTHESRLVTGTPSSVSIEQYRKLAAVLHHEQVENGLKTVMITSALPGEGKTLTAVNLALTLAESYERKVLLVDADLRGPSVHRALDLANGRGLSESLRDGQELSFVEVSGGLSVLRAGRPGPTPLAGLTSRRMEEILEQCASRFDWVLIDTPPVGVLPDAQVLARLAGALLFVVGAGSTPAAAVERSIAELGGPDAIFGLVLNRVEERRIPEASYYGRYEPRSSR